MQKLKIVITCIFLFALFGILWRGLFYAKPGELPSVLVGHNVPAFQLPDLLHPEQIFTNQQLKGKLTLVNVWASWCEACQAETDFLMQIKHLVPIYGINYKDDPAAAREWLRQNGNPYRMIGQDRKGDVAIDLGVYGTPELFVINAQGEILYRHVGMINQQIWDTVLYPLIRAKR
jgi:cytochrome c biogenesis protein CcmG/thiol:disulfide interchange protein DsbE